MMTQRERELDRSIQDRDLADALHDISTSREVLGKFTLRYMMEAVYGDDYTRQILGETGGDILMEDIVLEVDSVDGGIRTKVDQSSLRGQVPEYDPTPEQRRRAVAMLDNQMGDAEMAAIESSIRNMSADVAGSKRQHLHKPKEDPSKKASSQAEFMKAFTKMSEEDRTVFMKALRNLS